MAESKYCGRLFRVEAGQLISIVGKSCNNPDRFDVELKAECQEITFLRMSAAFQDEAAIGRNTLAFGEWGVEETTDNLFPHNNLNPLKPGGDFKIDIFVDEVAFFISIDDKPFCTYDYRMPVNDIQFINISGDVEAIYQVNQRNSQARPWPAVNVNAFEAFVPAQFNPGHVVVISGTPRGSDGGDFSVEFYDGSNKYRRHFQLRAYINNQTATLNSEDEFGCWRDEATVNHPFNITEQFKLAIAMTDGGFLIAANGSNIGCMPYFDHHERLFGSLTGVNLISNNGLNVQVQGVSFMKLDPECDGFETFSQI